MNWQFWKKRDAVPNPRGKKHRGDPIWMINLTDSLRFVNCWMAAVAITLLILLAVVPR